MKKSKIIFFIGLLLFLCTRESVFASATSSDPLNAGLLTDVWYSTTTALSAGDVVYMYSGFQNQTDKTLTGTATFYIDKATTTHTAFTAVPKSLVKLESKYIAEVGNHSVQAKITNVKEEGKEDITPLMLLNSETEKKDLLVTKVFTKESVVETVKSVLTNVYQTIDREASSTAVYLESLKTPQVEGAFSVGESDDTIGSTKPQTGNQTSTLGKKKTVAVVKEDAPEVGTSQDFSIGTVKKVVSKEVSKMMPSESPKDIALSTLIYLVDHWEWTVSISALLLMLLL